MQIDIWDLIDFYFKRMESATDSELKEHYKFFVDQLTMFFISDLA